VAGAGRGDTVLDPFMGTGTILLAALARLGAAAGIGVEVDRITFTRAAERLDGLSAQLRHASFESLDAAGVPEGARLVSNLPFGARFAPAPVAKLLPFLRALQPKLAGMALLLGREQAAALAAALRLRQKNVLVLGQPAAIVYGVSGPGTGVGRKGESELLRPEKTYT
jgi:hypothetical protein